MVKLKPRIHRLDKTFADEDTQNEIRILITQHMSVCNVY